MSSYAIRSFPEKSYGHLDCKWDFAEGIKKKPNGILCRGEKEERKRAKKDGDSHRNKARNSKEKGVVNGIELQGRKVQRGWNRPPAISTLAKRDDKRDGLSFRIFTTPPYSHRANCSSVIENYI